LGFRECSVADADQLTEWLVRNVTQVERSAERVREDLLARCREERVELPAGGRVDRIVCSALHRGEELLFAQVAARLPEPVRARLFALVAAGPEDPFDRIEQLGSALTDDAAAVENLIILGQDDLAAARLVQGWGRLRPLEDLLTDARTQLQAQQASLGYVESVPAAPEGVTVSIKNVHIGGSSTTPRSLPPTPSRTLWSASLQHPSMTISGPHWSSCTRPSRNSPQCCPRTKPSWLPETSTTWRGKPRSQPPARPNG
jgi:hypothetical protein